MDLDLDLSQIPFKDFLTIVAFASTITVSVSVSASQGFATAGNFFGVGLSGGDDPAVVAAVQQTRRCAVYLSWAASSSGLSLILTLLLQLLTTSPSVYGPLIHGRPWLVYLFGACSFLAVGLQAAALAMIGEAMRGINPASGAILQWCLLGMGLPALLLWGVSLLKQIQARKMVKEKKSQNQQQNQNTGTGTSSPKSALPSDGVKQAVSSVNV